MSPTPITTEAELLQSVREKLEPFGYEVLTQSAIPDLGIRTDVIVRIPTGELVVLELKATNEPRALKQAINQVTRLKTAAGVDYAFVVVPKLPSRFDDPNVIDLSGLEIAIDAIGPRSDKEARPPRVMTLGESINVFVAMPFNELYEDTYFISIRQSAVEVGAIATRIDDPGVSPPDLTIIESIHQKIEEADIVIADLSEANPNVLYELGYARAKGKPCILISTTPPEALPFDVRPYPIILYSIGQTHKLQKALVKDLKSKLK